MVNKQRDLLNEGEVQWRLGKKNLGGAAVPTDFPA